MYRSVVAGVVCAAGLLVAGGGLHAQGAATAAGPDKSWVERSNSYTQMLLDIQFQHSPESGSNEGLAKYDAAVTDPSRADEIVQRRELEAALAKIKKAEGGEKNKYVRQDMEILQKAFNLQFRQDDYQLEHNVPFVDASEAVFAGLHTLLDEQVAAERRPAAVVRLRKYAGVEPGTKPFPELLQQRLMEQMAKPGVMYPSAVEIETQLGRDKNYVDGMQQLFQKYNLTGWQEPLGKLRQELAQYDTWVRANVMPKARTDFKLTKEEYGLRLESYGIDVPPEQLAATAHAEFAECQAAMVPLALEVAKQHGWQLTDYRDVIRELKKTQIAGDAILPLYQARLKAIEQILVQENLITLPERPAIIRLASAAETAEQPAPHMVPPPLLHNTGQRGEFVLPVNAPTASGGGGEKYDDFSYDAAAWPITAHESRPGHELQFDSMVEHGVSMARALYAFNSTNVEGWGLYAERMMEPYEPADGRLITLQLRLLRASRAFLDSELEAGKVTEADAYKLLEDDVVVRHPFAQEEVQRFTYRLPGQANSDYFGYIKLLELKTDTEKALGPKFDQKRFHDFLLAQGLLPPDLLRKAVMEDFVPGEKKRK